MRDEPDVYGDNLDVRALVHGLARSKAWILAGALLGCVAGMATGVLRPNQYVSEGKIEVRLGLRESRAPESTLGSERDVLAPTPGIGDELALLYNPEVYLRVARAIGPERLLAPYDPAASDGPGTPEPLRLFHALQSWWARRGFEPLGPQEALVEAAALARQSIEVSALNGTSYLLVLSTASTPELAQLLTSTYVETARQWHREVYSPTTELTFVSDRLKGYEEAFAAAERAYAAHREQCGFYDLEEQKKGFVAASASHAGRLQENTIRLFEVENELAFVEKQLESTPLTIEKLVPPSVTVNPEYRAALDQLERLNGERASLASVYTEGSEIFRRKAEQIDAEVRRVEGRLEETPEFIEYGKATREVIPNPRHEELTIRRDELRQERETTAKTIELWQRSKDGQDERLRAALLCEPIHRELALAETRARARVQELSGALERAKALALLDRQEDLDSLRIAQEGELPRRKAGPDRKRFLLLGLVGGLALGMFLATLRFLVDVRLHDADAVRKELGLELIGVLPEVRRMPRVRRARGEGQVPPSKALARASTVLELPVQSVWTTLANHPREKDAPLRVLFASPRHGSGTTLLTTCAAMALCRNLHARVALVEANPFSPSLAALVGCPPRPGFAEVLRDQTEATGAPKESSESRLSLLPGSTLAPAEQVDWRGPNVRLLLEEELRAFSFALIDAPPLLDRPVGRLLLGSCDLAVLVLRAGVTTKADARAALEALRASGVPVAGVVLNRVRSPLPLG